jgi:hypothetical protein
MTRHNKLGRTAEAHRLRSSLPLGPCCHDHELEDEAAEGGDDDDDDGRDKTFSEELELELRVRLFDDMLLRDGGAAIDC